MLVVRASKNSQLTRGERHAYLGDRTLEIRVWSSKICGLLNFILAEFTCSQLPGTSAQALPPNPHLTFLQQDRSQDYGSFQNKLDIAVDIFEQEDVGEKTKNEDSDEGSSHRSFAAHQISAPNNDGSNRIEFAPGTRVGFPCRYCDV